MSHTLGYTTREGIFRTPEQIEAAFEACRLLTDAYAVASEDNGGDSSVEWEDVDMANQQAHEALHPSELDYITREARHENGVGEEPEKPSWGTAVMNDVLASPPAPPLAPFEFKRADDTEGGTAD